MVYFHDRDSESAWVSFGIVIRRMINSLAGMPPWATLSSEILRSQNPPKQPTSGTLREQLLNILLSEKLLYRASTSLGLAGLAPVLLLLLDFGFDTFLVGDVDGASRHGECDRDDGGDRDRAGDDERVMFAVSVRERKDSGEVALEMVTDARNSSVEMSCAAGGIGIESAVAHPWWWAGGDDVDGFGEA